MAEITILEQTTLDNFEDQGTGYLIATMNTEALLTVGETYHVVWDGTEYSCLAFEDEGGICVGNTGFLGATDTGEPFFIGFIPGELNNQELNVLLCAATEGTSHTFAIYQAGEAEATPSATVKIKGYSGAEFTYENVPKVWLAAPESTVDNPVLVPYTYGEAVDGVEIVPDFSSGDHTLKMPAGEMARSAVVKKPDSLIPGNIKAGETVAGVTGEYEGELPETEEMTIPADFSAGDMVLEPSEGKYLAKATVQMPETLIPENIAEGVDIAGIIGTALAGKEIKVESGITGSSSIVNTVTVSHNLGVTPDIIIVDNGLHSSAMTSSWILKHAVGFSSKLKNKWGLPFGRLGTFYKYVNGSSDAYAGISSATIEDKAIADSTPIWKATDTTFVIGANANGAIYGNYYSWVAIAGLT